MDPGQSGLSPPDMEDASHLLIAPTKLQNASDSEYGRLPLALSYVQGLSRCPEDLLARWVTSSPGEAKE